MKWIDYREKLGIGFCDNDKASKLKNKICIFIDDLCSPFEDNYGTKELMQRIVKHYFIIVGEQPHWGYYNVSAVIHSISTKDEISEIISKYVAFLQAATEHIKQYGVYKQLSDFLPDSLDSLNIKFSILEDDDGTFYFPSGAKELDDALVSQPFEWLENYPKARKTFTNALKQYSENIYIRDTADNFRKALEEFLQEFLGNTKNLDNNTGEIFKYLRSNNAEPELAGMMKTLISSYDNLNNKMAKHNDKVDAKYLEFLMYQTGIFIRLLVVIKNGTY